MRYAVHVSVHGQGWCHRQSHVVLSDIEVGRRGDEMVVKMMLPPKMMSVGRDHEITFTPVICSLGSADSVALPSFTVAGRNRYYSRLRDGDLSRGMKVYRAGHDPAAEYHAEVPYQDWMERCRVVMCEDVASCCNQAESGTMTPLAELDYRVAPFVPERRCYVALTGDSAVVLTAEGKAFGRLCRKPHRSQSLLSWQYTRDRQDHRVDRPCQERSRRHHHFGLYQGLRFARRFLRQQCAPGHGAYGPH